MIRHEGQLGATRGMHAPPTAPPTHHNRRGGAGARAGLRDAGHRAGDRHQSGLHFQLVRELVWVVDEVAARTVWAQARAVVGAAHLRLVLGVARQATQLLGPMSKLREKKEECVCAHE